jgi:hypothetical protein
LEKEKKRLDAIIKEKDAALHAKKVPLTVNRFDGLVHLASGVVLDPEDGHEVRLTEADA